MNDRPGNAELQAENFRLDGSLYEDITVTCRKCSLSWLWDGGSLDELLAEVAAHAC